MINAIIVGAPRSGTTSLFTALSKHPDICASARKELNWFLVDEHGEKPAWMPDHVRHAPPLTYRQYRTMTAGPGRVQLEASPSYWVDTSAARRIVDAHVHVRLIAVLRHPVDMAWSGFRTIHPAGTPEQLEAAMRSREVWPGDPEPLADLCLHGRHLTAYRAAIAAYSAPQDADRVRLKVLLFDDLVERPIEAMIDICDFLGIERLGLWLKKMNSAAPPVSAVVSRLQEKPTLKRLARAWLPASVVMSLTAVHHRLRSANQRPASELPPRLRAELTERYYADDIKRLERLLGRDLSHWGAGVAERKVAEPAFSA